MRDMLRGWRSMEDNYYWYHYDNRINMNNDYPYNQYEDKE